MRDEKLTEEEGTQVVTELLELLNGREWLGIHGRLRTFGSNEVGEAHDRLIQAFTSAIRRLLEWRRAEVELLHTPDGASDRETLAQANSAALAKFDAAFSEAVDADSAFWGAIRDDLEKEADGTAPGRSVSPLPPEQHRS